MKNELAGTRRQFIKLSGAELAAMSLLGLNDQAVAATNAAMRGAMKYQDKPSDGKSCSGCEHFVPGKTATSLGGCKLFRGDTEISPTGYCVAWVAKAK
jgi:anaerobic selenocysteine-containing dehydrogenase